MKKLAILILLVASPLRAAVPTVASALTITLHGSGVYEVTGTLSIGHIAGLRDGDEVFILPSGAFNLGPTSDFQPITGVVTVGRPLHFVRANGIVYEVGPSVVSSSGPGAPFDATYIVQTTNPNLLNEQVLGALVTGLLKNTTTTGVLSIAVAGTDYASATHAATHSLAGSDPITHNNLAGLTTGDPHTQYQLRSEKAAASGYASLNASTLVPTAQLGTGTANNTTFLRGDSTWQTVSGGGAPTTATYITQTADATLSAEQALSALTTGIVKVTTATGVLSTAIAADFPTLNQNTTGTAANVTGIVGLANGGTGISSAADDSLVVSNGSILEAKVLPSCSAAQKLAYETTTNTWFCTTDATGSGSANYVEVEVDFGASGSEIATATVTGQTWVTAASVIVCSPTLFATADRVDGEEDALVEGITVTPYGRVVGTGFSLKANPRFGEAVGKIRVTCTGA